MGQKVTSPPSIGIVIVTFNDPKNLRRLGESLAALTGPFTLQTSIIDNSTDPPAAAELKTLTASLPTKLHATYHPQTGNLGFAAGVNAGQRSLTTDYYWFINSDTTVDPNALTVLLETARTTQAAVLGSLILYADDQTIYYAGGTALNWLGIVRHPRRNQPADPHDTARAVSFVNGCAMFMPANTVKQYGPLYEPFFMYYEETDLCARIIKAGGKLFYEPRSIVYHYTNHTDDKSPFSVYFLTRNHWLYLSRNMKGLQQLTARLAVTVFQLYRFTKYLFKPPLRHAIVAGWRDAITKHYGQKIT